jgi:hypothetical protein
MHDSLPGVSKRCGKSSFRGKNQRFSQFSECEYNGTAVETDEEAKMRYHDRSGSTVLSQAYKLPQIQSPDVTR